MKQFIVAGQDMVPESTHEVAEFERARTAGQWRIAGTNTSQQEQPKPRLKRR